MITFSSQQPFLDLPTFVRNLSPGAVAGGAYVPGETCRCNCGMAAAMNNGTVDFTYQSISSGIDIAQRLNYYQYDFSDSSLNNYRLSLAETYYSSVLYFSSDSCLPEYALVAAPTSDGDWHLKHIYCRRDGTAEIGIAKFDVSYLLLAERADVIYGSILGDYETIDGDPVTLVLTQESVIEWRSYYPFYTPG